MSPLLITLCLVMTVSLVSGNNVQQLTSASTTFALRLYQKIKSNEGNVCLSPLSIHIILTLASLGARGRTRTEMLKVLGLNNFTGNSSHEGYQELIKQWENVTDVELRLANGLFLNPTKEIESGFIDDSSTYYSAQVSSFNFSAPGGPEKVVNDFVEQSTNGKIQDILDSGTISTDTALVAVNALLFNGTWANKFSEQDTKKCNFTKPDGTIIQVDTLYDERTVNIKRNVYGCDVAELDFVGQRFSLYIILPRKVDGITALEKSLKKPGRFESFFTGLSPQRVKIYVPKFNITSKYSLKSPLIQLGMVKAFQPHFAEFQGIANDISISDVVHQTVFELNEDGVVAAAATVIVFETISLPSPAKVTFKADHAFMSVIRDNETKQTLFLTKFSG